MKAGGKKYLQKLSVTLNLIVRVSLQSLGSLLRFLQISRQWVLSKGCRRFYGRSKWFSESLSMVNKRQKDHTVLFNMDGYKQREKVRHENTQNNQECHQWRVNNKEREKKAWTTSTRHIHIPTPLNHPLPTCLSCFHAISSPHAYSFLYNSYVRFPFPFSLLRKSK